MRHHPLVPEASAVSDAGVTVAAVSTTVLAANVDRVHVTITASPSNTETVWIARNATAVMNQGDALSAGGSLEIDAQNFYAGIISGICASGGQVVGVSEGTTS